MNTFWNDNLQEEISNIKKCKTLMERAEISELMSERLMEKMNYFLDKTENIEFQIAFVGTIKAGKSSLINSLLHGDYASTNVAPETAVLTKFGDSGENHYFLDVEYYSTSEWEGIWKQVRDAEQSDDIDVRDRIRPFIEEYKNLEAEQVKCDYLDKGKEHLICNNKEQISKLITRYTSSSSACHYFVKEVFVGIKNSGLPKRVVLCDTPGLDDVLEYRSNVTKKYIGQADAILVCVVSEFLGAEQLHTIMEIFSLNRFHPERIFVIGTKIDSLTDPKEGWKKQKEEWIKYLCGSACYNSRDLARKNIVGVSAWIEHLVFAYIKKENVPPKGYWDLGSFACSFEIDPAKMMESDNRKRLRKAACVMPLLNILNNRIYSVYKEALEQELHNEYELLCLEIKEKVQAILVQNIMVS